MPLLRTDWETARSAGEVPAGCHNMLVCRRTSVAPSPCLISLRSPLLFLPLLLSLSLCFHHLLISLSISPTFLLSLPFPPSLTLESLSTCWPVCLRLFFRFLPGLPPFFPHTSPSSSLTLKYVLVGCVSCRNASNDCILHPQCNNKAGVLLPPPFSSPSFFPFVPQK